MALDQSISQVTDLDSLLDFLRDDLDWKLPEDALIDDLTFEWDAEDLRIQDVDGQPLEDGIVRQLRPVPGTNQPWGIFFVEFKQPRLYKTKLRQILRGLVPNRQRDPSLPAWQHDNLLFLCTTGNYQQFTFAHFRGDKPQNSRLASFGWQ